MRKRIFRAALAVALAVFGLGLVGASPAFAHGPTVCVATAHVTLTGDPVPLLTQGFSGSFALTSGDITNRVSCGGGDLVGDPPLPEHIDVNDTTNIAFSGSAAANTTNQALTDVTVSGYTLGPCGGKTPTGQTATAYGAVAIGSTVGSGTNSCGASGTFVATFAVSPLYNDVSICGTPPQPCLSGAEIAAVLEQSD